MNLTKRKITAIINQLNFFFFLTSDFSKNCIFDLRKTTQFLFVLGKVLGIGWLDDSTYSESYIVAGKKGSVHPQSARFHEDVLRFDTLLGLEEEIQAQRRVDVLRGDVGLVGIE